MKGLFLKDASLYLRLYGKLLIFILLVFSILGAYYPGVGLSIGWFLPFYGIFLSQSEVSCRWDLYACSLPVSRAQIVSARFIFLLFLLGIGTFFGLASSILGCLFYSFSISDAIAGTCIGIFPLLALCGTSLWLIYRFGFSKSRIFLSLVFALPLGLGIFLNFTEKSTIIQSILLWFEQNVVFSLSCMIAVSILIFISSWILSIRCYKKMDF